MLKFKEGRTEVCIEKDSPTLLNKAPTHFTTWSCEYGLHNGDAVYKLDDIMRKCGMLIQVNKNIKTNEAPYCAVLFDEEAGLAYCEDPSTNKLCSIPINQLVPRSIIPTKEYDVYNEWLLDLYKNRLAFVYQICDDDMPGDADRHLIDIVVGGEKTYYGIAFKVEDRVSVILGYLDGMKIVQLINVNVRLNLDDDDEEIFERACVIVDKYVKTGKVPDFTNRLTMIFIKEYSRVRP